MDVSCKFTTILGCSVHVACAGGGSEPGQGACLQVSPNADYTFHPTKQASILPELIHEFISSRSKQFPFHSSALVLNAVIISFHPNFISRRAMQFAEMIKDCEETGLPKVGVSDDQTHLRPVCHPHTHTHTHTLHTPTAYILHTHTLHTPYLYTVQVVCVTRQLCSVS